MGKSKRTDRSIEDLLRATGVVFRRLEDVPVKVIRDVQRRVTAFPDMRSIELPPKIIRTSLEAPLLRDLLVTRIGYCSHAAGHYIPRPEGSLDHIIHHCVSGAGWLKMAGQNWNVGPNTAVCIPARVPHWYGANASDPWSIYWIHFTGRLAPDYFEFLGLNDRVPLVHLSQSQDIIAAFEEIWPFAKDAHTRNNLVQASMGLTRYLGMMCRLRHAEEPRSRSQKDTVRESIRFMTGNLGAEVSLTELAQLADMSVSCYTAAFRKNTGCSPKEYFNRLRIQKACELLQTTDRNVEDIARQVGFFDPYYFSRAFKRMAGVSPEKFRRR